MTKRGNFKTLIPTSFTALRNGFIAQPRRMLLRFVFDLCPCGQRFGGCFAITSKNQFIPMDAVKVIEA